MFKWLFGKRKMSAPPDPDGARDDEVRELREQVSEQMSAFAREMPQLQKTLRVLVHNARNDRHVRENRVRECRAMPPGML